ncbi:MAG: DUF3311 domain-containing protein [Planctomycetales bacterium]|nr:DUF3311 domain-containing protein [Planctomycetales bacterium]
MRIVIAVLVLILVALQQDYWLWDDATLVFGFLPSCLAWHMGVSVAASLVWLLAVQTIWPLDDDGAAGKGPAA